MVIAMWVSANHFHLRANRGRRSEVEWSVLHAPQFARGYQVFIDRQVAVGRQRELMLRDLSVASAAKFQYAWFVRLMGVAWSEVAT